MILQLILISAIATGDYKTREQAQHYLTILPGKFEVYRDILQTCEDPEVRFRLKQVAYFKWCLETDEKYRDYDYYVEYSKLNIKLQKEHFEQELKREYKR